MCKTKSQKQLFAKLTIAINPSSKTRQQGIFPVSMEEEARHHWDLQAYEKLNHRIVISGVKYTVKPAT